MATKHEATDKTGKVWTRTSMNRKYSHAVIAKRNAEDGTVRVHVCWSSRIDLAQKEARAYAKWGYVTEIAEARHV